MELSVGEMMLYGGAAAFVILLITLIVMLGVFKRSRRKLAKKIEDEMDK